MTQNSRNIATEFQAQFSSLRNAAFEFVREQRPGDLIDIAKANSINDLMLPQLTVDEVRYIIEHLKEFAEGYAKVIPHLVRERADFFNPPVTAPTKEQIVANPYLAIKSLESIKQHLFLDAKSNEKFLSFVEDVRYIVETCSRGILGIGKDDATEFKHILRALGSASTNASRQLHLIESFFKKILIPNPPPLVLPKSEQAIDINKRASINALPLGKVVSSGFWSLLSSAWKLVKVGWANLRALGDKILQGAKRNATWMGPWFSSSYAVTAKVFGAIKNTATFCLAVALSPLFLSIMAIRSGAVLAFNTCKKLGQSAGQSFNNVADFLGYAFDKMPTLTLAGVTAAIPVAVVGGAYLFFKLLGITLSSTVCYALAGGVAVGIIAFAVIHPGTREKLGRSLLSRAYYGCIDAITQSKTYRYLFDSAKKLKLKSTYDSMSRDVVNYLKRRRNEGQVCSIFSADQDFWSKLSVLNVNVISGKGGKVISLDQFFADKAKDPELEKQVTELREVFYRKVTFDNHTTDAVKQDETKITMPVKFGKLGLLLPLGYEISGIAMYGPEDDEGNQKLVENVFPISIEECALGSAKIEIPVGVHILQYRIRKCDYQIPTLQIERFHRLLTGSTAYKGIEGEAYQEALNCFQMSKASQVKLLFQHQIDRGFQIADENFLSTFIKSTGNAVAESIGGLRLGSEDALTYYSAAMFNANGVPAVIVSGLVPSESHSTFPLHGHSQTAVLTENGTLLSDISSQARKTSNLGSNNLRFGDQVKLLKRLWGLSYKQVFEYAAEVREVVTKPGKELNFFQQLIRRVFNPSQNLPFIRRRYRDSDLSKEKVGNDFDKIGIPREQQLVNAIATKIACQRTIAEARSSRSINQVHYFYKDNPKMPEVHSRDSRLVPKQHADIFDFNIRSAVINFNAEVLNDPGYSRYAKQAAIEWMLERAPNQSEIVESIYNNFSFENFEKITYITNPKDSLRLEDYEKFIDASTVVHFKEDQLKSLLFGMLALPITERKPLNPRDLVDKRSKVDVRRDLIILEKVQLLAQALEKCKATRFQRVEKEVITNVVALLAARLNNDLNKGRIDANSKKQCQLAIQSCAKIFSLITELDRDDKVSFFFDTLMNSNQTSGRSLAILSEVIGIQQLFNISGATGELYRHQQKLAHKIVSELSGKPFKDQDCQTWENTLKFFSNAGLLAPELINRRKIFNLLSKDLHRHHRKGEILIGFPDEIKKPASFLAYNLFSDLSATFMKIGLMLQSYGVLEQGQLEAAWPQISEMNVVKLLNEKLISSGRGNLRLYERNSKHSKDIEVARVDILSRELLGQDSSTNALVSHNQRQSTVHWSEKALQSLRRDFPREWYVFLKKFDSNSVANLLMDHMVLLHNVPDKHTPSEVYRSQLATAALLAIPGYRIRLARIIDLIASKSRTDSFSEIDNEVTNFFQNAEDWGYPFSKLSHSVKVAALIGSALLSDSRAGLENRKIDSHERQLTTWEYQDSLRQPIKTGIANLLYGYREMPANTRRSALLNFYNYECKIYRTLLNVADSDITLTGKTATASMWAHLYNSASSYYGLNSSFEDLVKVSRENATFFSSQFRDPLARFLYSRTGFVLVNAASGDFMGYRDYSEGDSLRQVDWKRSIKDGSLAVRLRDETEVRNIRLVYDLNLLVDSSTSWAHMSSEQRKHSRSLVKELFIFCNLAARENIQVDFALYGRGLLGLIPNLVKRSTTSQTGTFQAREFAILLCKYIDQATAIKDAEKNIFGKNGIGNLDIFAADDLPVEKNQIHVFAVSKEHFESTLLQIERLKNRRIASTILKNSELEVTNSSNLHETESEQDSSSEAESSEEEWEDDFKESL